MAEKNNSKLPALKEGVVAKATVGNVNKANVFSRVCAVFHNTISFKAGNYPVKNLSYKKILNN